MSQGSLFKDRLFVIVFVSILTYVGLTHLGVVFGVLGWILRVIMPFLLGFAIAFILDVPTRALEKHLGMLGRKARPIAVILAIVLTLAAISLVVIIIIPGLADSISALVAQVPDTIDNLQQWINHLDQQYPQVGQWLSSLDMDATIQKLSSYLQQVAQGLWDSGLSIANNIASGFYNFFIAVSFAIYALLQKTTLSRQVRRLLYALFPRKSADVMIDVGQLSSKTFASFLSGQVVEAMILGSIFFVVMSLTGFPYALLISVIIAVTALVPIFGAMIGSFIGVLLILTVDPWKAVWFYLMFQVIQQIENNFIYPRVVGQSVGLPALWVLFAITIGGNVMGLVGMMTFVPLVSVLYVLGGRMIRTRLQKKGAPVDQVLGSQWTQIRDQADPLASTFLTGTDTLLFAVLRGILHRPCRLIIHDQGEMLMVHSQQGYPVWVWTDQAIDEAGKETVWSIMSEQFDARQGYRWLMRDDLAKALVQMSTQDPQMRMKLTGGMIAYRFDEPTEPKKNEGQLRQATDTDLDLLWTWTKHFVRETEVDHPDDEVLRAGVEEKLSQGSFWFWEVQGQPCAMAAISPSDSDVAKVSYVFTDPHQRNQGYAGQLVYALSMKAAKQQKTVILYADVLNPVSNHCYQAIGFRKIGALSFLESDVI